MASARGWTSVGWRSARHGDTHPCDPCGWCDLAVGSEHGDPYVFPAGVAEQKHVLVSVLRVQEEEELELPIPEYPVQ